MTRTRVLLPAVASAVAVIAGFIVLLLVHSHDLARMPWRPIGLVVVALGAVGLMVSLVSHAMEIRGTSSGGSGDG
jgi:hypothetical protein